MREQLWNLVIVGSVLIVGTMLIIGWVNGGVMP